MPIACMASTVSALIAYGCHRLTSSQPRVVHTSCRSLGKSTSLNSSFASIASSTILTCSCQRASHLSHFHSHKAEDLYSNLQLAIDLVQVVADDALGLWQEFIGDAPGQNRLSDLLDRVRAASLAALDANGSPFLVGG